MTSLYDDLATRRGPVGIPGLDEAPINPLPDVRGLLTQASAAPLPAVPPPVPAADPRSAMVHTPQTQAAKEQAIAAENAPLSVTVPDAQAAAAAPPAAPSDAFTLPAGSYQMPAGPTTAVIDAPIGSRTTGGLKMSDDYKATVDAQGAAFDADKAELAKQQKFEAAQIEAKAKASEDQAAEVERKQKALDAINAKYDESIARKQAEIDQAIKAQTDARKGIQEFWSSKPMAVQALAAIAVMVNAGLRGRHGQASDALQVYQNLSNEDRNRKLQAVDAMSDDILAKRTGLQDLKAAREDMKERINIESAARDASAAKRVEAALLRGGIPLNEIANNRSLIALEQSKQDKKQQAIAPFQQRAEETKQIMGKKVVQVGGAGGPGGKDPEAIDKLNKQFKEDPEYKQYVASYDNAAEARELMSTWEQAKKLKGPALGAWMAKFAKVANGPGVVTEKDAKRIEGNEFKDIFSRGKDGLIQYLGGDIPASKIQAIEGMVTSSIGRAVGNNEKLQKRIMQKATGPGYEHNPVVVANWLGNSEFSMTPEQPQGIDPAQIAEAKRQIAANPNDPKYQKLALALRARGL